jgi:hypothetical protein
VDVTFLAILTLIAFVALAWAFNKKRGPLEPVETLKKIEGIEDKLFVKFSERAANDWRTVIGGPDDFVIVFRERNAVGAATKEATIIFPGKYSSDLVEARWNEKDEPSWPSGLRNTERSLSPGERAAIVDILRIIRKVTSNPVHATEA